MQSLETQEQFEQEIFSASLKTPVLIYFTADWCGPCKRVDWNFLLEEFKGLTVYKCNVDDNTYTPGFCGIRSIPNFMMVYPGKETAGPFQSSDTAKIAAWIQNNLVKNNK